MSSKTLLSVVAGLAAAAIVAGALVYGFVLKPKFDQSASAPAPQASASPTAAPGPSPMASAAPSAPKPAPAATPAAIPTPAFDVVRIEPSGDAVIAGRAAPNAAIVLNDGDKPIGEAAADFAGEFVILPPTLSPGSHSLRLSAKLGAAAPLVSDVYVAEVAGAGVAAKPATPTPTAVAATTATPAAASPPPMVAVAKPMTAASPAASASPTAAASPLASASPTAPASKPSAAPTPVASVVATPSPAASAAGEIVVGRVRAVDPAGLEAEGSAPPGAKVRLRLNDTLLAEAVAGPDGKWSLTIQRGLTPGDYVLEAEIVDAAGARVAHADAPFVYPRREAAAVAAATPQASPSPAVAPAPSSSQVAASPASSPQAAAPLASAPQTSPQASPVAVASAPVAPASAAPAPEPTPSATLAAPAPAPAAASPSPAATPGAAAAPAPAATPAAAAAATPVAAAAPAAAPAQAAPPVTIAEPTAAPPAAQTPVAANANPVVAEVRTVTVSKGDNLWDLARHFYGDGLRYADLYTANSTQIHDPNLIFVGQIFVVPQAAVAK